MNVSPNAALAQIRSTIDMVASWLWWIATTIIILIVFCKVIQSQGFSMPFIRYGVGELPLLYIAGILYLMKR